MALQFTSNIFLVYEQIRPRVLDENRFIHSAYSQNTNRVIPRIFSTHRFIPSYRCMHPKKTWIFGTKLFSSELLKEHYKKWSEGELLGLKSIRPNYYFARAWRENCFRINWLYVEWPWNSNIKFICKNNRGSELGDHVGSFDEKNLRLKTFVLLTYLLQK